MWDIDSFISKEDFVNALGRFRMTSLEMNPYEYPKATGYFIPNDRCNCRCVAKVMRDHDPIDRVIFNDPATVVYWKDGSKTVVKCGPDDTFDAEKGLAMAIAKKRLGNRGNYNKIFKKHLKEGKK